MALSAAQLDVLERALQVRQAELAASVDPSRRLLSAEGDGRSPEELEQAPPGADADVAIEGLHAQEIRDIEAANRRLVDGRYGQCVDCGASIPFARLRAFPTAKRCLGCQEVHERSRRAGSA